MASNDLVSIVICVYNAGAYFRASLESVVNQTYRNLDIVIVDDGSTDGCVESAIDIIHDDPRIRLYHQTNRGKPTALNRALEEACGSYFAMQDADDLSYPDRIERQVRYLVENPDVAAVFCGYDIIIGGRRMAPHCEVKDREQCRREISAFTMPGLDPTAMFRMSLVGNDRFCEEVPPAEGLDYILRVGEKQPLARIGECLYSYRVHTESVTRRNPEKRERSVRAVRSRACDRRGLDVEQVFPQLSRRKPDPENGLITQFVVSARTQKEQGLRRGALLTGLQAVTLRPAQWGAWKALMYALAPNPVIRKVRDRRMTAMVDRVGQLGP